MRLETLIDTATAIAGSQHKLAAAIGAQQSHVSEWKAGKRACPDTHVLRMARIAGLNPLRTALEVYKERLGELAKTLAIGAVGITLAWPANDAAAYAVAPSAEPNV